MKKIWVFVQLKLKQIFHSDFKPGLIVGLIILAFSGLILPFANQLFPYTHDGQNHLARFANYKIALKEGQLPPRWGPNLFNHYGYPVFNFNYPLANILSLPGSILKLNYELIFKLEVGLALLLAAAGSYLWLRQLKFSNLVIGLSLATFFLQPYLINILIFRGNIGELWALSLWPWLAFLGDRLLTASKKNWQLILLTGLLIGCYLLAHNLGSVLGLGWWLIYLGYRFFQLNVKPRLKISSLWLKFGQSLGIGVLASLWFWLPALAEKSLTVLDQVSLNQDYFWHAVTWEQLFLSPLGFGYSYPEFIDSLGFNLGAAGIAVLSGLTLLLITKLVIALCQPQRKKSSRLDWRLIFGVLSGWGLVIWPTQLPSYLISQLPLASYLQFPWRIHLIWCWWGWWQLPIFLTYLNHQPRLKKVFTWLIIILLFGQAINLLRLRPADKFHLTNVDYEAFSQSTSTMNENRAKNFDYLQISDWQPTAKILAGSGQIQIQSWSGSSRHYQLNLLTDSQIVEPTMNFAGWQTWVDGHPVEYLENEQIAGRIAYQLPAGQHQVLTKFTQQTWPRMIGNAVSLMTWLISIFLIINQWKKARS